MVSVKDIMNLIKYDPETGILTWKVRPVCMFKSSRACNSWNARHAGKEALCHVTSAGYKTGNLRALGVGHMKAHRVAYAIYTGEWPDKQIDHINGDKLDNRAVNLRNVSPSINQKNARKRVRGTSKFCGVHRVLVKGEPVWRAQVKSMGGRRVAKNFPYTREGEEMAGRWAEDVRRGLDYGPNFGYKDKV